MISEQRAIEIWLTRSNALGVMLISSVEGGIVALTTAVEFVTLRIGRATSCLPRRTRPQLKEVNGQ